MKITVDINSANLGLQLENAQAAAIAAVSQLALQDCNFYCKQDTNALIFSSTIHTKLQNSVDISDIPPDKLKQAMESPGSDIENGVLRWVMPYAEHQYTFPSAWHDKNANASSEWCERAYENHGDEWQRIFAETLKKGG